MFRKCHLEKVVCIDECRNEITEPVGLRYDYGITFIIYHHFKSVFIITIITLWKLINILKELNNTVNISAEARALHWPSIKLNKIKVKSSMAARSLPVENLLPQNDGQLSTTCSNLLKYPNGELLVAVDHNQLRTMASEMVDPIDW